jgi:uncharacterized membrane protein
VVVGIEIESVVTCTEVYTVQYSTVWDIDRYMGIWDV